MRNSIFCCYLAATVLSAQPPALNQAQLNARAKAQNVADIPFDSVPNFLKLPPNLFLGEGIGVASNSKGHVFVLSRSNTSGPAYGAAAAQLAIWPRFFARTRPATTSMGIENLSAGTGKIVKR